MTTVIRFKCYIVVGYEHIWFDFWKESHWTSSSRWVHIFVQHTTVHKMIESSTKNNSRFEAEFIVNFRVLVQFMKKYLSVNFWQYLKVCV